jgi:hypothetical protein
MFGKIPTIKPDDSRLRCKRDVSRGGSFVPCDRLAKRWKVSKHEWNSIVDLCRGHAMKLASAGFSFERVDRRKKAD